MKNTKERILAGGLDLLTREGFAGVTLGLLADEAGMSKSGLFAHFGSKEEVQLGLLEKMTEVGAATFVGTAMAQPVGLPRLEAVFKGWLRWTEKAGLRGGCPVAAGMFELDDADLNDPIRQRLAFLEERWRALLRQLASEAVSTGQLKPNLDLDQFVWEMCGIYLNHHVSYRFIRDPQANERAMIAFSGLLERSSAKPD
jgi:AcrR family transcriptional regulator